MATMKGGEKVVERLKQIARSIGNGGTLRVGWLEGSTYPDGKPTAMIAAITEFGAPSRGQPPRPAFRNMIADKQDEWPAAIAVLLKDNDYDAAKTLDIAGFAIAGQLKQSIVDITSPTLADSTIARKGFSKPWIESGHALQSVDHEVKS